MSELIFDEVAHSYTNEYGHVIPSVTQIIATVYGTGLENAPRQFVDAASKLGTAFHKAVERFLKTGEESDSQEFKTWRTLYDYIESNSYESEKVVYAGTPSGCFAGTADFISGGFLYDWKTSKTSTRAQQDKWQKQLSFYCYGLRKMGYTINEPLKVIHINGCGLSIINLDYLGDEWVEKTMALYKDIVDGRKTQQDAILLEQKALKGVSKRELKTLETKLLKIVELKEQAEAIKEKIKCEMAKRGIYQITVGKITLSFVDGHYSKKFDVTKFKQDHNDLYLNYLNDSLVKPSLRVTIKENDDDK